MEHVDWGLVCTSLQQVPWVVRCARTREVARIAHGYAGPEQPLACASAIDIYRNLLVHCCAQLGIRHRPLHQACQHLRINTQ